MLDDLHALVEGEELRLVKFSSLTSLHGTGLRSINRRFIRIGSQWHSDIGSWEVRFTIPLISAG